MHADQVLSCRELGGDRVALAAGRATQRGAERERELGFATTAHGPTNREFSAWTGPLPSLTVDSLWQIPNPSLMAVNAK